jgi:hypothetical protein
MGLWANVGMFIHFGAKFVEQKSLQGFGEEVPNRLLCRVAFDFDFPGLDAVMHKVVSNVTLSSSFAAELLVIVFKQDRTPAVLMYNRLFGHVSLLDQEVSCPQDSASSTPISLLSIKLLVLIFCLLEMDIMQVRPSVLIALVCPLQLR